jgi:hypothetical protein
MFKLSIIPKKLGGGGLEDWYFGNLEICAEVSGESVCRDVWQVN